MAPNAACSQDAVPESYTALPASPSAGTGSPGSTLAGLPAGTGSQPVGEDFFPANSFTNGSSPPVHGHTGGAGFDAAQADTGSPSGVQLEAAEEADPVDAPMRHYLPEDEVGEATVQHLGLKESWGGEMEDVPRFSETPFVAGHGHHREHLRGAGRSLWGRYMWADARLCHGMEDGRGPKPLVWHPLSASVLAPTIFFGSNGKRRGSVAQACLGKRVAG